MKIVINNKSGSVGKTTLTANLISPRVPNAKIYAVDPSNKNVTSLGLKAKVIDPLQFREMFEDIFQIEDAILDVGGSKIWDEFYSKLTESGASHFEFDYFLVPSYPTEKSEKDAAEVIVKLLAANIPSSKIRVIYNCVDNLSSFDLLTGIVKSYNIKVATVPQSDIYEMLANLGTTIEAVKNDPITAKEYRKLSHSMDRDTVEWKFYFNNYYVKGMVDEASAELDRVWAELDLV